MLKRLFLIAATLLQTMAVRADDYSPQTVDGVTYYVSTSTAKLYTRTAYTSHYWVDGYYYSTNCCRYYVNGYWQPYTAYSYALATVNVEAPDVDIELTRMARARDAYVLQAAARAQKTQASLALADKLGLNVAIPNYAAGLFPLPNYGGNLITNTAAASGSTVYGYSTMTLEAKSLDDAILAQALAQMGSDTPKLVSLVADKLERQLSQRAQINGDAYKAAVIGYAAAQLAKATGNAVQPKTDVKITQQVPVTMPPAADTPVEQVPVPPRVAFLSLSGPAQCIKCHGQGGVAKAQFDITLYNPQTASEADVDRVVAYITSTDPKASCGVASGRTKLGFKEQAQFLKR